MDVNATCSFEPIDARTMRMIVIEYDEDGFSQVIEIVEASLDDPRPATLKKLLNFDLRSGLDFILGFRAQWPVSLKGTRSNAGRIGRILDAYPGRDACGDMIELELPKAAAKPRKTRDLSRGISALLKDADDAKPYTIDEHGRYIPKGYPRG